MYEGRETSRDGESMKGIKSQAAERFFSLKVTLTASPLTVTFATRGLPNMQDALYRVFLQGETAVSVGDGVYVDESATTKTSFVIVGGTGAEVAHVLIHGNVDE